MLRPWSIARLLALAASAALVTLPPLTLGGCDKQNPAQPQAEQAAAPGGGSGGGAAETGDAASAPEMGRVDISHRGEAMPAAAFLGPDDKPVALPQFRGRPLLVNFWATWCGPCVKEMPALDALAGKEDRFRLIAVSQDMGGRYVVAPYFAKARFANLQPYLDKENVLMDAIKTDTLPTTIFYDAGGREQWRVIGSMNWSGARAKTLIDGALGAGAG